MPVKNPIKKIAMFTDIHFGKKGNSVDHNQDCLDFVDWFCDQVAKEGGITHILFLGDWFENRNAINVQTMDYSYRALKKIASIGLPTYIIVGNHDLYHRENRSIFSTKWFEALPNIQLIDETIVIPDVGLIVPFLFRDEYPSLAKFSDIKYWFGHFEFKDFVVTGSDRKMDSGPDHSAFKEPKYIFSGHFHKRQAQDNVVYIGNTFPMDYGDAWDDQRGMAILEVGKNSDSVEFINWEECPKYRKVRLTDVMAGRCDFPEKCRVRCMIDTEIAYSDAQLLKEEFINMGLREFTLEENMDEKSSSLEGDDSIEDIDMTSLNVAIEDMIRTGVQATTSIDPDLLVSIYKQI